MNRFKTLRSLPIALVITALLVGYTVAAFADVPMRTPPINTAVPNPGTQQQELANITAPAPYNVFEFAVTCLACHGGTIDQQAGHGGNWAGSSMASAARDPIFRANQIGVNNLVRSLTGMDGAGNMCFRCHSPNGWYSGRFDPNLAGSAEGETMIHSILASTDDEGILCEACHRTMGNVTFQRSDLNTMDSVWNLLAGIEDWTHAGGPYLDQAGDPTIAAGNPYGDTTLQINDGMTYVGKYTGSVDLYFSDVPLDGTDYTGQTYAIYPFEWIGPRAPVPPGMPQFNSAGDEIAYAIDGSLPLHFEAPIGPPIDSGTGQYDFQAQAISLEHPTMGDRPDPPLLPQPVPDANKFLRSSEFCGTCHDLTVPILNHGMPEQRTYTEWKFSDFGPAGSNTRCQDCHMPTMMHEYSDATPVSLNVDPTLAGWFPYAKDRNTQGGTAFHKFVGANRDLPEMMNLLYPEVDLEVIGAPTGNDTRVFPGMLSDRATMWDRAKRNTEVSLLDAVDVAIVDGPTYDAGTEKWTIQVQITNNAGHRIPSGYPDGRRFWLELKVTDDTGDLVYESGYYNEATAELLTDSTGTPFHRALTPSIDSTDNTVMVYERVTGTCEDADGDLIFPTPSSGIPATCTASPALTNNFILFDNRILPAGFDYDALRESGVKFWNYNPTTLVPYEENTRFPAGQNWDVITYTFDAPASAVLSARAEVYWQTHTREFMEHLRIQDDSIVRPEGPPSIYEPNYPLTPNYLSDQITGFDTMTALDGTPLKDNWGGIAYASWLLTGEGAPYLVAAADTAQVLPDAPLNVAALPFDPFTIQVTWDPVDGADGYLVWTRYGLSDATASWDKLAVVYGATEFLNEALNVGKSYTYKVQAFNGAGMGSDSGLVIAATPTDVPLPPEGLRVAGTTPLSIELAWFDTADNETGFIIQRQDVPPLGPFYNVADIPTPNNGGTGGVNWTDTLVTQSTCYNYQVAAYNAIGMSTFSLPVQGCTVGVPGGTIALTAIAISGNVVDLLWSGATGAITGYRVERSIDGGATWPTVFNVSDGAAMGYSDLTAQPDTTYSYRVFAYNAVGDSAPSNTASVTTPAPPPTAPTNLIATALDSAQVELIWSDNSTTETGFVIERSPDGVTFSPIFTTAADVNVWIDATVEPKMTYYYRVYAISVVGPSFYSNVVMVVTPGEIPQAPSNLRLRRISGNSIDLVWRDNATNEEGYYVERSLDGTTFSLVDTLPAGTTTYTDSSLTTSTTYWYQVQAYNADGVSAFTEPVSAKTKKK